MDNFLFLEEEEEHGLQQLMVPEGGAALHDLGQFLPNWLLLSLCVRAWPELMKPHAALLQK